MIWIYLSSITLLLGSEVNALLERTESRNRKRRPPHVVRDLLVTWHKSLYETSRCSEPVCAQPWAACNPGKTVPVMPPGHAAA
jgi:hypothetical protein